MAEKVYLICDCVGSASLEILTESKTNGVSSGLLIRGKFQEADIQNKNRRVYPLGVLQPQVEFLQECLKDNGLLGELDHPQDSVIHFENASHMITKLWWDGAQLMGEARVLSQTPSGKILEALIREGVKIGISSRGVGSGTLNPDGITMINDGFKLITFDVVADPSTPGAFLGLGTRESKKETQAPQGTVVKEALPTAETMKETQKPSETTAESQINCVDKVKVLRPELVSGYLKALFESKKR